MNKKLLAPLVALTLTLPAWAADDESPKDKAIKYRKAVMVVAGANFKPMGAMIKGEIPFDAGQFARYAKDLSAIASVDALRGYPEDSESKDSKAKPEIWLDWEDFKAKMEEYQAQATKLATAAAGATDKGAVKTQFSNTAKACKSCHKAYRE